ncbi:glycerol kinase [bacterium (Candidatus Blackallbacteria) CG17_big_fil_post_rev_8_21_14_2_50_48_46]|uniref:Glycerol kinase n=1 Tax=bacterium (Candidatus Blackallbacteria) CG17_big_fil_post_rev_8_21_14_2_50_48_46 TaxID=2014261 RepID=A0A2M7G5H6_9BACT|nr:MAG: glycerol kinase [bacterium (Candidatus Blackallbacteria) CG18_big_fil_WC_8_21_14_2_50_49_26]PIW17149.1 MAG: glycerol kinase [bacterium (Candidatus Blackallbacteria) CG17_big_fil_post_rev_8_21_14_2_50_48_46]PIW49999.1 MAG: glycerol kinase [bacterium (Candidatus Blackallbacteria) CG13_big_fil_rev_8_21_14_2_50_49_14]
MSQARFVLALDQGTTSSRAILFDQAGQIHGLAQQEFRQIYPQPGWVEHDADEIWQTQLAVAREVLQKTRVSPQQVAAIGVTNQRETLVLWEKATGKPLHHAIVWQCRRSAEICETLKAQGLEPLFREKTGLVLDAYFSGTKLKWLLDSHPEWRQRAEQGELLAGTIDSWLLYQLTGGAVHATEPSNASRTLLYNIREGRWDAELLEILGIPAALLPEVKPSSGVFGKTAPALFEGVEIPIAGMAGDQQAALFGQGCFEPGTAKNTYGTGCFMLMNTGEKPVRSNAGLLTTIAWQLGDQVTYALEGSVFVAGAVIQWLRDELQIIETAAESETLASQVEDTGGVYLVPAFVGLGAPHWDSAARGSLTGLTRGSNRKHIARAALESIAYQSADLLSAMQADAHEPLKVLRVDGGATANQFLMQFQADLLQLPVERPVVTETTALGAAYLAGLAVGYWETPQAIQTNWQLERRFEAQISAEKAQALMQGWQHAIVQTRA